MRKPTMNPAMMALFFIGLITTVMFLLSTYVTVRKRGLYTHSRTSSFVFLSMAWVLFIAGCGTSAYASSMPERPTWMKLMLWEVLGFGTSLWLAKASLMSIYWGMFPSLKNSLRWGLGAASAYVALTWVVLVVSLLSWCHPTSKIWAPVDSTNRCNPIDYSLDKTHLYLYTVLNTTSDAIVLFIPFLIFKKALDRVDIFSLIFLISLGFLTLSTTIIRMVLMSTQTKWTLGFLQLGETLVVLECGAAIVAASLPGLRSEVRSCIGQRKQRREIERGEVREFGGWRGVRGYSFGTGSFFKSYDSSSEPATPSSSMPAQVIPDLTEGQMQRVNDYDRETALIELSPRVPTPEDVEPGFAAFEKVEDDEVFGSYGSSHRA
ncbi:hypothetical protein EDC01DRAFT_725294 [Geopyxis carbonaria]|nr:hypothetical protein EDC01DRAFT_725294 [Geopyxis carbonaria]